MVLTGVSAAARLRGRPGRGSLAGYLYLAPAAVLLAAFHIYPLFYGAYVSLFRWGLTREAFVGLSNYRAL
ncbi:MAG: sugar ABC transporter permease, partial [Bacillati bacterium ANGP1]